MEHGDTIRRETGVLSSSTTMSTLLLFDLTNVRIAPCTVVA